MSPSADPAWAAGYHPLPEASAAARKTPFPRRARLARTHRRFLLVISLLLLALGACNQPVSDIQNEVATPTPSPLTITVAPSPSAEMVTPTATAVPIPTANREVLPPLPSAEEPGELAVGTFTLLDSDDLDGGKRVTLGWSSNGASARLLSGVSRTAPPHWQLPPRGEVTVVLTETHYADPPFTLQVFDTPDPAQAGAVVATTLPFTWPCNHDYFFTPAPALCPRAASTRSPAAEQPFTGGVMIWLEAHGAIYVFYPDGEWERFADTWTEAEAESDPSLSPPADRYQPIRGFGKVWREHDAVREQLGWATSPELGFTSEFQQPLAEAAGEDEVLYLRTFNGQVFYIVERAPDRGEWGLAASW